MTQLQDLTKPFPDDWVQTKDTGKYQASYVEHSVVAQRLLQVVGPYSTDIVEIVRGHLELEDGTSDPQAVLGVVLALTVTVEGESVTVTEAGDAGDNAKGQHDGQRLKDAMSDALKRCAMRLGCGLHLWAQDRYFLHKALTNGEAEPTSEPERGYPVPPEDDEPESAPESGGGPVCADCGGSLVGASATKRDGQYVHQGGCYERRR